MATVIDSLIVSLGMDSSKFTKGQKEAINSLKNMEAQSGKTANALEKHAKNVSQAFGQLKNELLSVAALYVSFNSIKSFITNTVMQTSALGRMSEKLDMNAKELAQWELAAKHAGGSADSMVDSIRGANDTISKLRLGQSSEQLQATYNYAGVGGVDVGNVKSGTDLLLKQADIIKGINEKFGANQARMASEQMGIHESEFQLFKGGSDSVQKQLEAQSDLADKEAKLSQSSEELRKQFDDTANKLKEVGITILKELMPAMLGFSDYLGSPQTRDNIKSLIDGIGTVVGYFKTLGETIGWVAARLTGWANDDYKKDPNELKSKSYAELKAMQAAKDRILNKSSSGNNVSGNAIVGKLVAMGWTPAQASGMVGSLQQESATFDPSAENKDSKMYGIVQWDKSRREKFEEIIGKPIKGSSVDEQLRFMNWELNNSHKSAGDKIRASKTAEEAAQIHSDRYEKASKTGKWAANDDQRRKNAANYLSSYNSANVQSASQIPMSLPPLSSSSSANKSTSVEANINSIVINTKATDANGISAEIGGALQKNLNLGVSNANTGVT